MLELRAAPAGSEVVFHRGCWETQPRGGFVPSQRGGEDVNHDPAAFKTVLVSPFRPAIIDYF